MGAWPGGDPTEVLYVAGLTTVVDLVWTQATCTPDAPALYRNERAWTYSELVGTSDDIATGLLAHGLCPGDVVAINCGRTAQGVMALLGVMRAGLVALPLDPSQSLARTALLLDQAAARLVIVDRPGSPGYPIATAPFDELACTPGDPVRGPGPEAASYVFFTSGTTGTPKCVLGWHGALADFVQWEQRQFRIVAGDRVAQIATMSFDAVLKDIFPALIGGATVHLPPMDRPFEAPADVLAWLDRERISVVQTVPSVLASWLAADRDARTTLSALRLVCLSGEPLAGSLVTRWRRRFPESPGRVVNLYGTTESTILKSWYEVPAEPGESIQPVGRPIDGAQLLVLNAAGGPCGIGEPGEVVIRSRCHTRGYLNPAAGDRELFRCNPFRPDDPTIDLHSTGDIGRWDEDGSLYLVGRVDDQLKIRGVRVQPAQVAAALSGHPDVADAAVIAGTTPAGEPELIAYVVAAGGAKPDDAALRRYVSDRLARVMVPAWFVVLPSMPLSENGKLDRSALPAPVRHAATGRAVAGPTQRRIAAIWSELLGTEVASADDEFFRLGGHSLLAVRMLSRAYQDTGVMLPLVAVFDRPSLSGFCALIDDAMATATPAQAIQPAPVRGRYPLSLEQQGLWFLQQLDPDSAAYNMSGVLKLPPGVDPDAVREALQRVVANHEALRTRFTVDTDQPVQVVDPVVDLELTDFGAVAEDATALATLAKNANQPFDLAAKPPVRAALVHADAVTLLGITVHHIVCDAWSWEIITDELAALLTGNNVQHHAPRLQYGDYIIWQQSYVDADTLERALDFWRTHLADRPPALDLPGTRPRPPIRSHSGAVYRFALPAPTVAALDSFTRVRAVSTYVALLSAFGVLLGRAGNQEAVVLGTDSAGRTRLELESVVGFFVRTLALRIEMAGDPDFAALVDRVQSDLLSAHTHESLPFQAVVAAVGGESDPSRSPLFDVMFRMPPPSNGTQPRLAPVKSDPSTVDAKFDLTLMARKTESGVECEFEYNTDLFPAKLVADLARRFVNVVTRLTDLHGVPISRVGDPPHPFGHPLPARVYPRVFDRFHAVAARTPDAVAVRSASRTTTYRELEERMLRVARTVSGMGERIAIVAGKSAGAIVSLLGVLRAGAVAIPVDEALPAARQQQLLERAGADGVIDAGKSASAPGWLPSVRLEPDDGEIAVEFSTAEPVPPAPAGDAAAYVFFTSGTTGEPKGVLGVHRAIDHFTAWETTTFSVGPGDGVAQLTSFSFDAVLRDIFVPLTVGATVCVPADGERDDTGRLLRWMDDLGVTIVHTTPSLLGSWLAEAQDVRAGLSSLRCVLLSGEPLLDTTINDWRERYPRCSAVLGNFYGQTETTMIKSWYAVPSAPRAGVQPIGEPQPHTQIAVLGHGNRVCVPGERGEIVVRTPFRALGYIDGSAGRFTPNPFTDDPDDLLYYTGDTGVVLSDGSIVAEGRTDGTVKIRGVRVHPAEVEVCVTSHPGVTVCHVEAVDSEEDCYLVAFVVNPSRDLDTEMLRGYLRERLPASLVPRLLLFVERIPLLPNGKVDRARLVDEDSQEDGDRTVVAPRTPTEERVLDIWAGLLKADAIGVFDDFFEIGGHSLLATVMISRIRRQFTVAPSLRAVFEDPTVAGIARDIDRSLAPQQPARSTVTAHTVVRFGQPRDRQRPFVLVHPIGGEVLSYRKFADLLDRETWCLRAAGLSDGERPRTDLREMAAAYLHELRDMGLRAPFLLGGWSVGGLIAFEMARQLTFEGEPPGKLVLIDAYPPASPAYREFDGSTMARCAAFVRDLRSSGQLNPADDPVAVFGQQEFDRRVEVFAAHSQAVARYRVDEGALAGSGLAVVQLHAVDNESAGDTTATDWSKVLGTRVDAHRIAADHYTIMSGQALREVVNYVKGSLDRLDMDEEIPR